MNNNSFVVNSSNPEEQFEMGIALMNKAWKAKETQMMDEIENLKRMLQKKHEEIQQQAQQYSKLHFEFQSQTTAMKTLQEMNQDLQLERDRLSQQVKSLSGEVAKLKQFKKTIIQSINFDDNDDTHMGNTSQFITPSNSNNPGTNTSVSSYSEARSLPTTASSQMLNAPQIEGKEFFRHAKDVLSARQFSEFLQQIKLLNNQQQSPQQTLQNVNEIFNGEHPQLLEGFKRILTQRQQAAAQATTSTSENL
ncbi:hypothetical protein FDP41_008154 [Naegleria fowleri]|uniref:At4g15545-like C-terminal domain-containing protein n=1 Tax=Naegleria fowleri TaxID=5763 RepID=A0A6A5BHH1_NAEFO|nr:uncharacterized protein FDP41_008154 [Naegleria fowleri]KAF0973450.1 hypothetical protein FDP41_008154 [Naegleria fowleri]CAG4713473.1 unnamed protein product [Naegleria fowleri]